MAAHILQKFTPPGRRPHYFPFWVDVVPHNLPKNTAPKCCLCFCTRLFHLFSMLYLLANNPKSDCCKHVIYKYTVYFDGQVEAFNYSYYNLISGTNGICKMTSRCRALTQHCATFWDPHHLLIPVLLPA